MRPGIGPGHQAGQRQPPRVHSELPAELDKQAAWFADKIAVIAKCIIGTLGIILVSEVGDAHAEHQGMAEIAPQAQVQQLHRLAHQHDVPVLCYGLRSDFQGNGFPGAVALLTLADDLEEMKTICACARKASMNVRFDGFGRRVRDGDQVEIGGNERYRAVCPSCFYADQENADGAPGLFG